LITVGRHERPASASDTDAALAAIERGPGVWLGCDVEVPGLYQRRAMAALDPLLAVVLDGNRLRLVPQDAQGRSWAERLASELAPMQFEAVDGRLECDCSALTGPHAGPPAGPPAGPHPAIVALRRLLALCPSPPAEFGLFGTLAFDYHLLSQVGQVPDDGRRRLALFLPRRVLVTGDHGAHMVTFDFPDLPPSPDGTPAAVPPATLERRDDDLAPGGHAAVVARGVERMASGSLCSLVLSQTFRRPVQVDAAEAFSRLRRDNPYPAMFFANLGGGERLFGASPDIQVRADAQWVETAPVCGTFRRGSDALDDYAQAKGLMTSDVDEASLAVCADSDRNDKARVCVPGSVEQVSRRRLHFFSTIIHAIDHTRGRRRADCDAFDIVLAHATPATVTGMPKAVARTTIQDLEPGWRGWYAGAAVRLGADGGCEALTMLRFARLVDGLAEVRTGGSLLADSDPVREEAETRLKAETLFRVLAGQSPRAAAPQRATPTARAVHFIAGDDPLAPLLAEALCQAGCQFDPAAALVVLGDGAVVTADVLQQRPVLAINRAGLAMLQADGATPEPLPQPQFGRSLACQAEAGNWMVAMDRFDVGVYTTHRLSAEALPDGWTLLARGEDNRVVAACHRGRRAAVLLCRPDSVLSLRHAAGQRALTCLLDGLAALLPGR
jgi:anthranilate synthase